MSKITGLGACLAFENIIIIIPHIIKVGLDENHTNNRFSINITTTYGITSIRYKSEKEYNNDFKKLMMIINNFYKINIEEINN